MAIDNFRRVDFTLDKANGYIPSDQFAKENDNNGRELTVQITDGGVVKDQSSLVLTLAWKHDTAGNEGQTLFTRLNGGQGIFTVAYDNAMMIPGTVTACIQIADGSRLTNTRNFKLRIEDNPLNIDKAVAEDSFTVFVEALAGLTKYDGRIASVESEVATARGGYANLNTREDTQDNAIIAAQSTANSKFDSNQAEAYLKSITALPETFANLAEIKNKYPSGKNGLMVAADNGHKYIWANNVWTDAGVYQSVGIADGSIGNKQLAPSARYGSIVSGAPAKINSVAKTLTLESVWAVFCGTESLSVGTNSTVTIALDPDNTDQTGFWIGFLPASKEFSIYQSINSIPENVVYLGWISIDIAKKVDYDLHINDVEVDGLNTKSLAFDKKAVVASWKPFALDLKNKTLTPPPADSYMNIFTSEGQYRLITRDPVNLDNGASVSFVYYAISTGSITTTNATVSQSSDLIFLGWVSWDIPTPNYDFIFNYTVNGIAPGLGLSFGFANKVGTTFGDSITQGTLLNGATNWTTMLGEKLHLSKITNAGISGTTYSKDASRTDSAVDRVSTIKGQDLITVWFGINDYHFGRPLGAFGDGDVTTVFGAADYVYKTLITNNPTATIVVITPMKQHGYSTYPDSFTKNSAGLLQIDYVNAIKQVADYYSLPILNLYQMSGMSPFVDAQKTQYFFDGLHPNAAGQYRVAQKIARFIEING